MPPGNRREAAVRSRLRRREASRFAKPRKFPTGNTAVRRKKHTECAAPDGAKLSERKGSKGFKFVCANLLFWCADSRFAEPRIFPERENGFILFACTKRTKSTPEVCEPLDSGDDSKLCRKRLRRNFQRLMSKPVLPAKRRRKGFESVRKGYRSADARPMFFEKELLYCKLTTASGIQKGLLHVSLGAV